MICGGRAATIVGTAGPEPINGTFAADVIHGLGGADAISGLSNHDVICGGPGRDTINGGGGNDRLFGMLVPIGGKPRFRWLQQWCTAQRRYGPVLRGGEQRALRSE